VGRQSDKNFQTLRFPLQETRKVNSKTERFFYLGYFSKSGTGPLKTLVLRTQMKINRCRWTGGRHLRPDKSHSDFSRTIGPDCAVPKVLKTPVKIQTRILGFN
jgi:hypothetical protein